MKSAAITRKNEGGLEMQISEVVKEWCREHNATTRAYWWLYSVLLACLAGLVLIDIFGTEFGLLLIFVPGIAWIMFAPRPVQLSVLRTSKLHYSYPMRRTYNGLSSVPDSLLAKLADATTVSEVVKTKMADILGAEGRITFEVLFDIERQLIGNQYNERFKNLEGFQKMAAFRSNPTQGEK